MDPLPAWIQVFFFVEGRRRDKKTLPTNVLPGCFFGSAGHPQEKLMHKNDLKLIYERLLIKLSPIPPRVDPLSSW
jgi:hypothetical protein